MKARVTTFDGNEAMSDRIVDYTDSAHRSWLHKHITWAINNGKSIEIDPVSE